MPCVIIAFRHLVFFAVEKIFNINTVVVSMTLPILKHLSSGVSSYYVAACDCPIRIKMHNLSCSSKCYSQRKRLRVKSSPVAGYLQIIGRSNQGWDKRYPIDAPLQGAFTEYANSLGLSLGKVHFQQMRADGNTCLVDGGNTLARIGWPELVVIQAVNYIDHIRDRVGGAIWQYLDHHKVESSTLFAQLCLSKPGAQKAPL